MYCRWFAHFYALGSIVNTVMFLLVIFSYMTSSTLPVIVEVSIDMLNVGLKQDVVNTGEIFTSCRLYTVSQKVDHPTDDDNFVKT